MSSIMEGLGQVTPQLLAGYGQGRAKAEDYNFRARQAEAQRAIAREAAALRRAIAQQEADDRERTQTLAQLKHDLDKAEHEARIPLMKEQERFYRERSETWDAERPGRTAQAAGKGRTAGFQADVLGKKIELKLPEMEVANLGARTARLSGEESRAKALHPDIVRLRQAQARYLGAQATSIPKDDARLDRSAEEGAAHRRRMAGVAERGAATAEQRAAIEGQKARDYVRLQTAGLNLEKIRTTNDTARASAYAKKLLAEVKYLEGFPKQWIQSLDRDIKIGYAKDRYGNLDNKPAAAQARARADFLLKSMEKSILHHDFEDVDLPSEAGAGLPHAPTGLPVMPPVWPAVGTGAVTVPTARPPVPLGMQVETARQGARATLMDLTGGLSALTPDPKTLAEVKQLLEDPPAWQYHISQMRDRAGDVRTPNIIRTLAAYEKITGRKWHFTEYKNRPAGISNGDIDTVKALLANGTFDGQVKAAKRLGDTRLASDLERAWRYLYPRGKGKPRPATGSASGGGSPRAGPPRLPPAGTLR